MIQTIGRSHGPLRSGGLLAGILALVLPLGGCGDDQPSAASSPTPIAISPSSASPTSVAASAPGPSDTTSTPAPKPPTGGPSIAQSETIRDAAGAVAAAEGVVPDGTTVEVSRDDDGGAVQWEVTVRVGDEGRELRLASDGSVISDRSDQLAKSQLGEVPEVTATDAIETAENKVSNGAVDDIELTSENGQRVWDVSVDVAGGNDWELWIDASSGKVVHEERD